MSWSRYHCSYCIEEEAKTIREEKRPPKPHRNHVVGQSHVCLCPELLPTLGRPSSHTSCAKGMRPHWDSLYLVAQLVKKKSACNAGDLCSILGLGKSPREGKRYPLQYSDLENSVDSIFHGVTKSHTWLSHFHFHFLDFQKWSYGTEEYKRFSIFCQIAFQKSDVSS